MSDRKYFSELMSGSSGNKLVTTECKNCYHKLICCKISQSWSHGLTLLDSWSYYILLHIIHSYSMYYIVVYSYTFVLLYTSTIHPDDGFINIFYIFL